MKWDEWLVAAGCVSLMLGGYVWSASPDENLAFLGAVMFMFGIVVVMPYLMITALSAYDRRRQNSYKKD